MKENSFNLEITAAEAGKGSEVPKNVRSEGFRDWFEINYSEVFNDINHFLDDSSLNQDNFFKEAHIFGSRIKPFLPTKLFKLGDPGVWFPIVGRERRDENGNVFKPSMHVEAYPPAIGLVARYVIDPEFGDEHGKVFLELKNQRIV
jgi:hypothetical protein